MKTLAIVVAACLASGCAPYPDYGSDSALRQEQAEIDKEAQAEEERNQQNRIDQQQLQTRQQQQQQREDEQKQQLPSYGTPSSPQSPQ